MGNGVSTDQGNLPTHDKRDVSSPVDEEQYDWSELAEKPETNSLLSAGKPYTIPPTNADGICESTPDFWPVFEFQPLKNCWGQTHPH